jgi:nicotinate dehydrogenase subunit B
MSLPWQREPFEPERYELAEGPRWQLDVGRRGFLQALGGGIAMLVVLPEEARAGSAEHTGAAPQDRQGPEQNLGAWLAVAATGAVTAVTGKVGVGQDIRTSLAQAVAEELHIAPGAVELVMGDTDRVPFDRGTFGSRTTPSMAPQLRAAAAALRAWLLELGAASLGVDQKTLEAEGGAVRHGASGRSVPYGELVKDRALERRIGEQVLRPASEWRVCGRDLAKGNGRALVTGAHRYPSDVVRPGMLHGRVLRPAAFGGKLKSLDAAAAKAMPGVTVVRDGDFTGVTAPTAFAAARAVAALVAAWEAPEMAVEAKLADALRRAPARGGREGRGEARGDERGDVALALAGCAHTVEATFTIPYIAHAPLEPRAAVAEWHDGKVTVWTGTQRPFGVRDELMQALKLPADKVRVLVPDTGSGYGGKHTGDAAVEAAILARGAGRPVRVAWTREEEFTWAYFRPAGVLDVRAGIDADGRLLAWEFHNHNSGGAGLEPPYAAASRRVQFHAGDSPLRQGSYRALASTANHFARESVIDDLAAKAKIEPLEFRRRNLAEPRVRAVLDAAAARAGWGEQPAEGIGRGLACGMEKGGCVATVADVRVEPGGIRVLRLVTAFECGAIVHPDGVENQVEGAVVQGLGGALFEAIRFDQGRIENPRFSSYRVPRFADVPELVTVLLDRKDLPSAGAGETPIVAVAPAIRNALAAVTGQRLCALPLRLG